MANDQCPIRPGGSFSNPIPGSLTVAKLYAKQRSTENTSPVFNQLPRLQNVV
jgi:hypothetical protein